MLSKNLISEKDDSKVPVTRIFCVGKNYSDHVVEMGGSTVGHTPVFFMKPLTAIPDDNIFVIPDENETYDYEVELAVVIGTACSNVSKREALSKVSGYGVALDMTCRSQQKVLAGKGSPWEAAKALDNSMPISKIIKASDVEGNIYDRQISLSLNGELRQKASLSDMILNVEEIISEISKIWKLLSGDVILTGTPSGVGAVKRGDKIVCEIENLVKFETTIG